MKRVLLVFFTLLLTSFFYFSSAKSVNAQGTCACTYGMSGCDVTTDNCDTGGGYAAECTSVISECSPGYNSCTCELVNPGGDPTCGATSQPCCSGLCDIPELQCVGTQAGDRCLGTAQYCCLPGSPGGPQCAGITCGYGGGGPEIFCVGNDPDDRTDQATSGRIATAIGCIPIMSTGEFTGFLLRWGMGIAGGIALLLVVYAGFLVISSGGNPQKLTAGKELLTAALTGLLLLVFGAFILEFIGVDILGIPGFGG